MKFSKLYEEVHKLSDFDRISHEAVVHPKSEVHTVNLHTFQIKFVEIDRYSFTLQSNKSVGALFDMHHRIEEVWSNETPVFRR